MKFLQLEMLKSWYCKHVCVQFANIPQINKNGYSKQGKRRTYKFFVFSFPFLFFRQTKWETEHCNCMAFSVWQNEWMIHYECFPNSRRKSSANKRERERKKIEKIKLLFAMATNKRRERNKSKKKAKSCDVEMANCMHKMRKFWVKAAVEPSATDRHTQWIDIELITMSWSFCFHFASLIYKWFRCANHLVWSVDGFCMKKTANFYQRRFLARKKFGPTNCEWLNFSLWFFFLSFSHLGLFKIEDPIKLDQKRTMLPLY